VNERNYLIQEMRRSLAPSQRGKRPLSGGSFKSPFMANTTPLEQPMKRLKVESVVEAEGGEYGASNELETKHMKEKEEIASHGADLNEEPSVPPASATPLRRPGQLTGLRRQFKSPTVASPTTARQVVPKPLLTKEEPSSAETAATRYYRVMWCKFSRKKHKTYNDGSPTSTLARAVFGEGANFPVIACRRAGDQGRKSMCAEGHAGQGNWQDFLIPHEGKLGHSF